MSNYYEVQESQEWDLYQRIELLVRKNPWTWQSIGAVLGLVGGILSPVLGTLLIAVMWIIGSSEEVSVLNVVSIVSFVLTLPLLAGGAHCLDLLERKTAELFTHDEQQPGKTIATAASLRGASLVNGRGLKVACAAIAALLFTLPTSGHAQQTIFNVPSSDVLDKGRSIAKPEPLLTAITSATTSLRWALSARAGSLGSNSRSRQSLASPLIGIPASKPLDALPPASPSSATRKHRDTSAIQLEILTP